MTELEVIKFGGSVQKTKENCESNCSYVIEKINSGKKVIPVFSASYKVTDRLAETYDLGIRCSVDDLCKSLRKFYESIVGEDYMGELDKELGETKEAFDLRKKDKFITSGESHAGVLHKILFEKLGYKARFIDGFDAGVHSTNRLVDSEKTLDEGKLESIISKNLNSDEIILIGGYRGIEKSMSRDYLVQLPNNSTDATSVLVAAVARNQGIDAKVEMLKDVEGVKEVNFHNVKAEIAEKLSYREAIEISTNGAEVVYPVAIDIARNYDVPVIIKNKESQGTLISKESATNFSVPFAAMSVQKRYQITLIDPKMIVEPESVGYFEKVIAPLVDKKIDIKHTPDSAETITLTVNEKDSKIDGMNLEEYLSRTMSYMNPEINGKEIYLVSLVGEQMRHPGTLKKVADVLAEKVISIKSLSQPDEDYAVPSITIGIAKQDIERAVSNLYESLFIKPRKILDKKRDKYAGCNPDEPFD